MNRTNEQMDPFIKTLEENWYDTIESLEGVSSTDLEKLGLPQRLCKSIIAQYSQYKHPTTVDQPKSHTPDNIDVGMNLPSSNGLHQIGTSNSSVPNPFQTTTLDPMAEDIKAVVEYWNDKNEDYDFKDFDSNALKTLSTLLKNMLEQPFEEKYRKINLTNKKIIGILKSNMKLINFFKEFHFRLIKTDGHVQSNSGMEQYINKAFHLSDTTSYSIYISSEQVLTEQHNKLLVSIYNLISHHLKERDIEIAQIEPYSQFKSHFTTLSKSAIQKDMIQASQGEVNLTNLDKMIIQRDNIKNQIEDSIPRKVEDKDRQLKVHFSRALGLRLGIELPDPIELAEEDEIDDEALILKNLKNEMMNMRNNSKFKSRRLKELEELSKMKNSSTTIQLTIVVNKDVKLEFTASIKEIMEEIYDYIASILMYKGEFNLFITPPKKLFKKTKNALRDSNIKKSTQFRIEFIDENEIKGLGDGVLSKSLIEEKGMIYKMDLYVKKEPKESEYKSSRLERMAKWNDKKTCGVDPKPDVKKNEEKINDKMTDDQEPKESKGVDMSQFNLPKTIHHKGMEDQ